MFLTRLMPSSTSFRISCVFLLLFGGEIFALVAQGEQAGGGEVQRIVDFVDDARAHAAQRRQLFGLHQLRLGFLELFDGGFQHLVLLGELALVLVRFDQVLDAHVQFGGGKRLGQKIARAGAQAPPAWFPHPRARSAG